jgi:hypothetical protein
MAKIARTHTMAIKKKQQAKKSVLPGECVLLGGCTNDANVVRGAERVRERSERTNASELR